MIQLNEVSKTSILTLICRVVGADKRAYAFDDPKAVELYELLYNYSSISERQWMTRVKRKYRGLSRKSVKVICKRTLTFDKIANAFVDCNSSSTIINLGCGFDTRYWRMRDGDYKYIDLDLPEVIGLKTRLLDEKIQYESLGISVLDTAWIDQVTKKGNENFLIIAEGLFMYLPKEEVVKLIQLITERFGNSQLVFDTVHEKFTRGIWKWLTNWNWRKVLDLDFNYTYGIKSPTEIQMYSKELKVTSSKNHLGHLITLDINNTQ